MLYRIVFDNNRKISEVLSGFSYHCGLSGGLTVWWCDIPWLSYVADLSMQVLHTSLQFSYNLFRRSKLTMYHVDSLGDLQYQTDHRH